MTTFTHHFDTPLYKRKVSFETGVFIDGKFSHGSNKTTIDVINPTDGRVITSVSEATPADVDRAVAAAKRAYEESWGLKVPGTQRGLLLSKLADLIEKHAEELGALDALDNGMAYPNAKNFCVGAAIATTRYYAGWGDKIQGEVIETSEGKLCYTRREAFGVVGQITPWNIPTLSVLSKIAPALITGNCVVLKPSELTPLSALRLCGLINEAGFPPGVVNILVGYGNTVGQAISEHMEIDKISFTGSALTGRKIMAAAAKSNLKNVTLELGGKSPNIILDDADLGQAVKWAIRGIFSNQGQACVAGSRIFVQAGIYDEFLKRFKEAARSIRLGLPFTAETFQGPQVSKTQYERIMGYIESGKQDEAHVETGGSRHGDTGYWIQPTIFTDTRPDMKIVQEEIFGPVGVVIKFTDEEDALRQANNTIYGLAAGIHTKDIERAFRFAHKLQAGTVWINCTMAVDVNVPFGGYKQSGIGKEFGYASIETYTNLKAVHVNLSQRI